MSSNVKTCRDCGIEHKRMGFYCKECDSNRINNAGGLQTTSSGFNQGQTQRRDIKQCRQCGRAHKRMGFYCKECDSTRFNSSAGLQTANSVNNQAHTQKGYIKKCRQCGVEHKRMGYYCKACDSMRFNAGDFFSNHIDVQSKVYGDEKSENLALTLKDDMSGGYHVSQGYGSHNAEQTQGMVKVINAQTGTLPISQLEVGSRVVDPSWAWEYRNSANHQLTNRMIKRPVEWIIAAKNHYEGIAPHVTLLAVDCIACYAFDDGGFMGRNFNTELQHISLWTLSGSNNAKLGLRPWLNSVGINEGEGFFAAFSDEFKSQVFITQVPNKDGAGNAYITLDRVFIPSSTELGDMEYRHCHPIGECFPHFYEASDWDRITAFPGKTECWVWWTRSPDKKYRAAVSSSNLLIGRLMDEVIGKELKNKQHVDGEDLELFINKDLCVVDRKGRFTYTEAGWGTIGVRPVINIDANTLVIA